MANHPFKLGSLIENHETPFVVIDSNLTIVAVNRAWEQCFNLSREHYLDQICCKNEDCRHRKFLQTLESYQGNYQVIQPINEKKSIEVRGFPLLDVDGTIYIGETVIQTKQNELSQKTPDLVGNSEIFVQFQEKLDQAASSTLPVLIHGETGTGKSLASEYIHAKSSRASGPFIVVDCIVLDEDIFAAELFGSEPVDECDDTLPKQGWLELADKGTIFLDGVEDLPLSQQKKLFLALESKQFQRVGGTKSIHSDFRLICSSKHNLQELAKKHRFREDLFYLLSVFPIHIPSLQDRKQDIPPLIDYFLEQYGNRDEKNCSMTKDALIKLMQYNWPGNVQELSNCIQLALGLHSGSEIDAKDININEALVSSEPESKDEIADKSQNESKYAVLFDRIEIDFIKLLIKKHKSNRKMIADEMNISERTLYRKLRQHHLHLK